jgi:hypothetical protein
MKTTVAVHTLSRVGAEQLESRLERTGREHVCTTITSDTARVRVAVNRHGVVTVETFRLAEGGNPDSRESINWIDDASILLRAGEPTLVGVATGTHVAAEEPLPF